jgi:hypothetical protein
MRCQELWSHRQLIAKRPPLDGLSAARDHIITHCKGKGESMPLLLIGAHFDTVVVCASLLRFEF